MTTIHLNNNLGLAPPQAKPSIQPIESSEVESNPPPIPSVPPLVTQPDQGALPQTEFAFELPIGYVDSMGRSHRQGIMRMARTVDEIEPMSDPRVQANPAYATVIILAQVIVSLGTLPDVNPAVIEGMFAGDLNYLQNFYRKINLLEASNP